MGTASEGERRAKEESVAEAAEGGRGDRGGGSGGSGGGDRGPESFVASSVEFVVFIELEDFSIGMLHSVPVGRWAFNNMHIYPLPR